MTRLNSFWTWLGQSSGQIQIVLAIIGLIFAAVAAWYAKNQISLAQAQRSAELKLQLLNSAHEYLTLILELRHQIKLVKMEYLKETDGKNTNFFEDSDYGLNEYFNEIESLLDNPQDLMQKIIKVVNNPNTKLSIQQLEKYLISISSTGGSLRSAQVGLNHKIEDLKESKS